MNDQIRKTIFPDGIYKSRTEYTLNGVYHNENDEPAIIWGDGDKKYYQNGKLHRLNGAAVR